MSRHKLSKQTAMPPAPLPPGYSGLFLAVVWAAFAWGAGVLYLYGVRYPWIFDYMRLPVLSQAPTQWFTFIEDARALFLFLTLLLGITAAGSYVLRLFRLSWRSALEETVFSVGMGLGVMGYLVFVLGLLQLYRGPVFWSLWAAGLILAWRRYLSPDPRLAFASVVKKIQGWRARHQGWAVHQVMLLVMLGVGVMMTFVPEVFYDAMVYHLGVPNFYLHEGGIRYYPALHAQFPFLRQMINVLGLALDGVRLAKLLHWSSAPLLMASYAALADRYDVPRTGLIASLALFSMPMVNMNLWTTGIDIGLTSYAFLAFAAWINGLSDSEFRSRWFTLAGVFGGFCFACKYPGLILLVAMGLATLFWIGIIEKNGRSAVRECLRLAFWSSLLMLPWLIKTWVMTGNPVFPYLYHWFGGRDLLADRLNDFLVDTGTGAKHHWLELLISPWSATFSEVSSFTAPGVFLLGGLGFLLAGLFRKEIRKPWYGPACLFFALYWFCVNAMTDRMRLAIPGIAVGCFLLAYAMGVFYKRGGPLFRFALAAWVALSGAMGLASTYPTLLKSYIPWDVWLGRESAQEYLSYTHPGLNPVPATQAFVFARAVVPPGHRLLIIGDEKTSPCPVPYLASGVHNDQLIVQWSRQAKDAEDLMRIFREQHISHVLINLGEAIRLSSYKILNWDEQNLVTYTAFYEKHLRLIHEEEVHERFFKDPGPLFLYEVVDTLKEPPTENVLIAIYEQLHFPPSDPQMATKRRKWLESLDRIHPGLRTVRQRLDYWRYEEKRAHARPS